MMSYWAGLPPPAGGDGLGGRGRGRKRRGVAWNTVVLVQTGANNGSESFLNFKIISSLS